MRRTPTVRQACLLFAAGWLATGAPLVHAAAIAAPGSPSPAAIAQPPGSPSSSSSSGPAVQRSAPAEAVFPSQPPSVFDALDLPEPQLLAAADSFSQSYLTPAGFSREHANDGNASRLHLPRHDPDLDAADAYASSRYSQLADEEMNPAVLWLSVLGLATAGISGILQYARNPITRKRKYRNYDRAPRS